MTGIDPTQLRVLVIRPALERLQLWSAAAEDLVLGTAAVESGCGRYVRQVGGGPALGIFQMEPATHDDLWRNYLRYKPSLWRDVASMTAGYRHAESVDIVEGLADPPPAGHLVWNLAYAAAMARIHYRRAPEALPQAGYVAGMARYWKKWYNTPLGAGTVEKFERAWKEMGG